MRIFARKTANIHNMERAFVYGMSVEGVNFTDRVKETKRLKLNFENAPKLSARRNIATA